MGLFEDVMVGLFNAVDQTPQGALMNDNARAQFENMRRQKEFDDMHPGWRNGIQKNNNSGGDIAGKVLVGAAAVGGAMLLKHIFSSDDKKENKNPTQNNVQPSNR